MYKNATIYIYAPTIAKNAEGDAIKTWGTTPVETIRADVQPKTLTDAQYQSWGISDRNADTKIVFYERADQIKVNNRAKVVSDFPGEPSGFFEIKVPNHWPRHGECILVPVQGES